MVGTASDYDLAFHTVGVSNAGPRDPVGAAGSAGGLGWRGGGAGRCGADATASGRALYVDERLRADRIDGDLAACGRAGHASEWRAIADRSSGGTHRSDAARAGRGAHDSDG